MKKDNGPRDVAKRNANAEKEAIRCVIDALEALEPEMQGRIIRAAAVLLGVSLFPPQPKTAFISGSVYSQSDCANS